MDREQNVIINTQDNIEKFFVSLITTITGKTVIIETKNDRRPKGNYISLWWKQLEPLVQNEGDYFEIDEENMEQELRNEVDCILQISFWGDNAYQDAIDLLFKLQTDERHFDLHKIIGYGGFDSVQDISATFGAKIQQRAVFNFSYYANLGARYPAEWFDVSKWVLEYDNNKKEEFDYSKEIHDEQHSCMS